MGRHQGRHRRPITPDLDEEAITTRWRESAGRHIRDGRKPSEARRLADIDRTDLRMAQVSKKGI